MRSAALALVLLLASSARAGDEDAEALDSGSEQLRAIEQAAEREADQPETAGEEPDPGDERDEAARVDAEVDTEADDAPARRPADVWTAPAPSAPDALESPGRQSPLESPREPDDE